MSSQKRLGFRKNRAYFLRLGLAIFLFVMILPGALSQSRPGFDRVVIDSLDPAAWNGIVFLAKAFEQPASFALRIGSRGNKYLVGNDVFQAVREVGPHAPDASYCRLGWAQSPRENPVKLEWARVDQMTVIGRLTAPKDIQLVLETYFPFTPNQHVNQGLFSLTGLEAGDSRREIFRQCLRDECSVHRHGGSADDWEWYFCQSPAN